MVAWQLILCLQHMNICALVHVLDALYPSQLPAYGLEKQWSMS